MEDHVVSLEPNPQEPKSNIGKWILPASIILLILILGGLGYFIYNDYQKTYKIAQQTEEVQRDSRLTLLPQFAPKQQYPEEQPQTLTNLNEVKTDSLLEDISLIKDNPDFLTNFTDNYTLMGEITEITTEYPDGITQVFVVTIKNDGGKTLSLRFSLEEIGISQVFVDKPGNIEEVGFLDLKTGDKVEIRVTNVITNDSPTHYLIRVLSR